MLGAASNSCLLRRANETSQRKSELKLDAERREKSARPPRMRVRISRVEVARDERRTDLEAARLKTGGISAGISLRAHLMSIATQHACEVPNIDDEHEMAGGKLNAIIRAKLDIVADFPQRVTDEKWFDRLDDELEQPRRAKRKLVR